MKLTMPYAVYLEFDKQGSFALRQLENYAGAIGEQIKTPHRLGHQPHLTMAVYKEVDVETLTISLANFVNSVMQVDLNFPGIGCFPNEQNILFALPTITKELLQLHADYHNFTSFAGHGEACYHVGKWLPHATIAVGLSRDELSLATSVVSQHWLPINCKTTTLRLVQFSPVQSIWSNDLLS